MNSARNATTVPCPMSQNVNAAQTPPAPESATAPTVAGSPLELFLAQVQGRH
ncbi:MAG TPA: hypothetical protein VFP34_08895 [Microlunatus sp.]|nr:hypothetical protein [Microlunatus sp.]